MERYYKRKIDHVLSESSPVVSPSWSPKLDSMEVSQVTMSSQVSEEPEPEISVTSSVECHFEPQKQCLAGMNLSNLPKDPGLRPRMIDYHPNIRHEVRMAYLLSGPCQPRNHKFPKRKIGQFSRGFNCSWFHEFGSWLEYSISKDAVFCLCCYLFKPELGNQGGRKSFVTVGFKNWKKKDKLRTHVGGFNSMHNQAWNKCQALLDEKQYFRPLSLKLPHQRENGYDVLLSKSVDCARFLLRQGLDFDGYEEFDHSSNEGNFLELLNLLSEDNEGLNAILSRKHPETLKLMTHDARKDIVTACAVETTDAIVREIGDGPFSIFFGESLDVTGKEHIALILRYVDRNGFVVERFLGLKSVADYSALTCKAAVEDVLSSKGLSISRLRGQSYDVTSDRQAEINALKTLIMEENEQAYHVHHFSHQLESAVMSVAKNHILISVLAVVFDGILNVIGASCKHQDVLREKRSSEVIKALKSDTVTKSFRSNKDSSHISATDTLQQSYYYTVISLIIEFPNVLDVLEDIVDDGHHSEDRGKALNLLGSLRTFDFVFSLHLMLSILGKTSVLSSTLQWKDHLVMHVVGLVEISKKLLQTTRASGWSSFMDEVSSFCGKHCIDVPNMDEMHVARGASKLRPQEMTNYQYYRVELFDKVIDMEVEELNDRFNKVNSELFLCVDCFNPSRSFVAFDKKRLIQFAEFYPKDFSVVELLALPDELENFIIEARSCIRFSDLKGIDELARVMVETRKYTTYSLVYRLLTLALILPIAPAKVERALSSMKTVKKWLCNQIGDEMMSDRLVAYIERDMFRTTLDEAVINSFHSLERNQGHL